LKLKSSDGEAHEMCHPAKALSFADGHAERWGWRGLSTEQAWQALSTTATANDLKRLQEAVAIP
jgi:hypothetical protein